jgi:hypothetical protein
VLHGDGPPSTGVTWNKAPFASGGHGSKELGVVLGVVDSDGGDDLRVEYVDPLGEIF